MKSEGRILFIHQRVINFFPTTRAQTFLTFSERSSSAGEKIDRRGRKRIKIKIKPVLFFSWNILNRFCCVLNRNTDRMSLIRFLKSPGLSCLSVPLSCPRVCSDASGVSWTRSSNPLPVSVWFLSSSSTRCPSFSPPSNILSSFSQIILFISCNMFYLFILSIFPLIFALRDPTFSLFFLFFFKSHVYLFKWPLSFLVRLSFLSVTNRSFPHPYPLSFL